MNPKEFHMINIKVKKMVHSFKMCANTLLILFLWIPVVLSFSTSSQNYEITGIIDSGSSVSSSQNYKVESALGEQIVGIAGSQNYNVYLGYFFMEEPFYNFSIWVEAPSLFTIGKKEEVYIYIKNLGNRKDSYTISYTKEAVDQQLNDVSHLLTVEMPSNKVEALQAGKVSATVATILVSGPIREGRVTFNVVSDTDPTIERSALIIIRGGLPTSLPEFGNIGMIGVMILATLIYLL